MEYERDGYVFKKVEITKRPGQSLGFYIRQGNGCGRSNGVFISGIEVGTAAESNKFLYVGDEIITINNTNVSNMSIDDVVISMSIHKKLILAIRTLKSGKGLHQLPLSLPEQDEPPVVIIKKGKSWSDIALKLSEVYPKHFESNMRHELSQPKLSTRTHNFATVCINPEKVKTVLLNKNTENNIIHCCSHCNCVQKNSRKRSVTVEAGVTVRTSSPECNSLIAANTITHPIINSHSKKDHISQYYSTDGASTSTSNCEFSALHRACDPAYLDKSLNCISNSMHVDSLIENIDIQYNENNKHQMKMNCGINPSPRCNRILRNASPHCYNSDTEVLASQTKSSLFTGFVSDNENYSREISDDNSTIYSIPHKRNRDNSEFDFLLHKFASLSHELREEHFKLQKQYSLRKTKGTNTESTLKQTKHDCIDGSPQVRLSNARTSNSSDIPVIPSSSMNNYSLIEIASNTKKLPENIHKKHHICKHVNVSPFCSNTRLTSFPRTSNENKLYNSSDFNNGESANSISATVIQNKNINNSDNRLEHLVQRSQLMQKPMHIAYSEFMPYRADIHKRSEIIQHCGLDGLLNIHIMSGQGLKSTKTSLRDLYCVVAVDSISKARTMIRTGAMNFDWDEAFDVELDDSKEISFLVYHWDPSYKHRLCFHGSVFIPGYTYSGHRQYVAAKMEPKGIIFVTFLYTQSVVWLQRAPSSTNFLFGVELEVIINRQNCDSRVPLLILNCVKEVEIRGLHIVGIYRLCGSSRRKAILRDELENNSTNVDLSPVNVSDIHVVTGVLKDFLRELPEPLLTNALYQMLLDAMSVRLPSDPEGSAKLMLSILECLPSSNQETLNVILNHLKCVADNSSMNKMNIESLATCFGPLLLYPTPSSLSQATNDVGKQKEILKYLLEIWT